MRIVIRNPVNMDIVKCLLRGGPLKGELAGHFIMEDVVEILTTLKIRKIAKMCVW